MFDDEKEDDKNKEPKTPNSRNITDELNYDSEDYADDSSDEDEINGKIESYSVKEIIHQFSKKEKNISTDYQLSLLIHAMGLKILYSKPVNDLYYKGKIRLLGKSNLITKKEKLETDIFEIIKNSFSGLFPNNFSINYDKVIDLFIEKNDSVFELQKIVFSSLRLFLISKNKIVNSEENHFIKEIGSILENCFNEFSKFLEKEEYEHTSQLEENYVISINDLKSTKQFKKFKSDFLEKEENSIIELLGKHYIYNSETGKFFSKAAGGKKNIKKLEDNKNLSPTEKTVLKSIKSVHGNSKNIGGKIHQIVQEDGDKITFSELEKISDIESQKEDSPFKKSSDSRLKKYQFRINETNNIQDKNLKLILQEKVKNFSPKKSNQKNKSPLKLNGNLEKFKKVFFSELKLDIQWDRALLPEQYTLHVSKNIELLSGIRLFNRSGRRLIKTMQDEKRDGWSEITNRGIAFDNLNSVGLENQYITKNEGRLDFVPLSTGGNSYSSLAIEINKLIESLNIFLENTGHTITDSDIAYMVQNVLNGDSNPIRYKNEEKVILDLSKEKLVSRFLAKLTYLLFVTEVSRNPASLIIHQMVLDLIRDAKFTWTDFFQKNGFLPMAKKDAVAMARLVREIWKNYLPFHYEYSGENAKQCEDLVWSEINIIKVWLFCYGKNLASWNEEEKKYDVNIKKIDNIIELIEEKIKNTWYIFPSENDLEEKINLIEKEYSGRFYIDEKRFEFSKLKSKFNNSSLFSNVQYENKKENKEKKIEDEIKKIKTENRNDQFIVNSVNLFQKIENKISENDKNDNTKNEHQNISLNFSNQNDE